MEFSPPCQATLSASPSKPSRKRRWPSTASAKSVSAASCSDTGRSQEVRTFRSRADLIRIGVRRAASIGHTDSKV
jgi:hypothetical protein